MPRTFSLAAVEERIRLCQGLWTLLDADLAAAFGLSTTKLLEHVRRFEPLAGELGFHVDRLDAPWAPFRQRPAYVFTEHGVLAVAFMIGSAEALARSIEMLRLFERQRRRQDRIERVSAFWRSDSVEEAVADVLGMRAAVDGAVPLRSSAPELDGRDGHDEGFATGANGARWRGTVSLSAFSRERRG